MAESRHSMLIDELKAWEERRWETRLASLWASGVPMNAGQGDNDSDDDDDDSGDSGDDDTDDEDKNEDGSDKTPEQKAVDDAFAKLRVAEKASRDKDKEIAKLKRSGMTAAEAAEARATDAEAKVAEYERKEARAETEKDIARIAKQMKFTNPEAAKRFVGADVTDDRGIKDALKEALEDFPNLAGDGSPPPPVNEGNNNSGSANQRMNDNIRRAAGRTAV